jgi:hypothetical protein
MSKKTIYFLVFCAIVVSAYVFCNNRTDKHALSDDLRGRKIYSSKQIDDRAMLQ